jgi:hypothetical protein
MAAIAARKMIVPHPASFQMPCAVSSSLKVDGSDMTSRPLWPWVARMRLMTPPPPRTCWNSATMMTHDRKCGR